MKKFEKLKPFLDKFWIRKDRETYFFGGIIISAMISSYIVAYWQYSDRMAVKPKIKIGKKIMSREKEFKRFREADTHSEGRQSSQQYYRMEEKTSPKMPTLYREKAAESDEEN